MYAASILLCSSTLRTMCPFILFLVAKKDHVVITNELENMHVGMRVHPIMFIA